ncbi:DUF4360 domain-containing protein [Streptomyces uncialis]|uniref:DUF4360 domain-containing protein n=1 Tax=Streptomyces uncialis TaxID=1048205 RepID=UPI002E2EDA5D|nr:DUF4360 domain-containing protein [Streptomyces uncialis]
MARGLLVSSAVAALLAAVVPAQSAGASSAAPPDKVTVDVVTVNGSGCRAGTAAVATSPDNTAFTVTYSDYLATAGGASSPTAFRKNCQLSLLVNVPHGFTYAITSADYRGFASLQPGVTAVEKASYYFQGSSSTNSRTHTFTGPMSEDWQATDTTDWAQLVWAPCGAQRSVNVNTELRVQLGGSDRSKTSFMTMDSTDGSVNTVYHLAWKQCPAA